MNDEVREAIEAARTAETGERCRPHSFERLRRLLWRLVQTLPPSMTIHELQQELGSEFAGDDPVDE